MYAIIETGGKQYRVSSGDKLRIERLNLNQGDAVEFKPLLIGKEGGEVVLQKGKVIAEVLRHGKYKKVIVFKFRAKKNYKRWRGHRQPYTEIIIREIKEE